MNKKQLRSLTERVLKAIDLYSPQAVELVLGTIAQESAGGESIRQMGNGPALGICQMEPATFDDIYNNFLRYKKDLKDKVLNASGCLSLYSHCLEYNMALSIAMCRVHYYRVPEAIPADLPGWARYWKKYYNTHLGKGTEAGFIANYKKHVL
ncbi:MAG: hypothetical protein ACRDDZ_05775 [Marinifilaceae bacterium]